MFRDSIRSICLVLAMGGVAASADEVLFNNGDRLTGKVVKMEGGKLTIATAVAGEISVDLKKVKTFSTEEPVEMHLKDGTVVNQKVDQAGAGEVAPAGGGVVPPQPIGFASIKAVNPTPVKWKGAITAGMLLTRGNSNTDNANVAIDAARRAEQDRITFGAGYLYGRQEDPDTGDKVTTTDSWFATGKYDYFFNPKFYSYVQSRVERDRIAALDLRFIAGVGLGYQWLEGEKANFLTEAGGSWFYEDYATTMDAENHFSLRLAYKYDQRLNGKVTFFHNLEYFPSVEDMGDFLIVTDAGVRASLTKRLFTELKVQLNHDSTPAEDANKTDVRYMATLGWTF